MMEARKRVLFVDDEPAILASLKDLLYRDRKHWDMVFVTSAREALDQLRASPFDVIVSDMRMPVMDGAALLEQVRNEFPATVRIILSGHADRDAIMRALPSMHQFLSKPCDPGKLRDAIERSLGIVTPPNAAVRAIIGRLDKLPTPPQVFHLLAKLADDPKSTIEQVVLAISRDPALSAKVLQLANSAAFGVGRPVSGIGEAVRYMGFELLKCLALATSVFAPRPNVEAAGLSLEAMQETALQAATFARQIAQRADSETLFAATLLHDIGETILACGLTEPYAALCRDADARGESRVIAERRELGASHAEVGACLLGMWGLPVPIVELVAVHHDLWRAAPSLHRQLAVLHAADILAGGGGRATGTGLDLPFLETAGVTARLDVWRALAEAA